MRADEASFADRDALIGALRDAVELEMLLMLQYLYAAYSVPNYETGRRLVADGVWSSEHLTFLCGAGDHRHERGLRGTLIQTANEEMIHFLMVNNLLLAVGGPFYVPEPRFTGAAQRFGLAAELTLAPLSLPTLGRFVCFEAPAQAQPERAPGCSGHGSVSALYRRIRNSLVAHPEWILVRPGETGGEHHLFLTARTNRHHPDYQCQVDDLASALFTLDALTEQGEGAESDGGGDSHWQRFCRLRDGFARLERERGEVALYPCLENPSREPRAGATCVRDADARLLLQIFNASFAISMQMMVQHFSLAPRRTLRRSRLMNASIDVMAYVLGPLAVELMSCPSGVGDRTAGPSFELPQPVQFIPDQEVAQRSWSREFDQLATVAAGNPRVPEDVTRLLREYGEYAKTLGA